MAEVKRLELNMKQDFPNTFLSFGDEITFGMTKTKTEDPLTGMVALRFDFQDVNSEMSKAFKTPAQTVPVVKPAVSVKDLVGIVAVAHQTAEGAVTLLHAVLTTLGYKDETNSPGLPAQRVWVYRDLTFHGIEIPPPGLITSAYKSKGGDYYEVVQPVNFAFHITV